MVNRRRPSGAFLRRVNSYTEPTKQPVSRIRRYKDSDAWLWTEVAAVVVGLAFVIPTAIALWIDLEDRQTQRIAQAWELVTRVAPGNAGKGPALEYLNSQGIPLTGIDLSEDTNRGQSYLVGSNLSGAYLISADLSGAVLIGADLSGAVLTDANLSGADLRSADLSGAVLPAANLSWARLYAANLSGADLRDANLSGADLRGADLSGAYLWSANLSGADLRIADLSEAILRHADLSEDEYLTQNQLDTACGDEGTQLPEGLIIKDCPTNTE